MIDGLFTTTSIDNISDASKNLRLYPVPARERIFVKSENEINRDATVNIISSSGKLVHREKMVNNSTGDIIDIPLAGLNAGVYILQIQSANSVESKRFIIER